MIEAFEIGVSLALRDGVSEGIAAAKRNMACVEAAIASGTVSMQRLREAAAAAMGAAPVDVARKPKIGAAKSAAAIEASLPGGAAGSPQTESSAPDLPRPSRLAVAPDDKVSGTRSQRDVVDEWHAPSPVADTPLAVLAMQPPDVRAVPPRPSAPTASPVSVGSGDSAIAGQSPNAEFWSAADVAAMAPVAPPIVPLVIKMSGVARQLAPPLDTAPRVAPAVFGDAPAPARVFMPSPPVAPWGAAAQADREDTHDAAHQVPAGPSAPLDRTRDRAADGGDVYLDGMLVGRWMSRFLAREAGRSSVGPTGFDARRHPLMPGSSVGS